MKSVTIGETFMINQEETMEKIKVHAQKLWVDYKDYLIGAAIGLVIGIIVF